MWRVDGGSRGGWVRSNQSDPSRVEAVKFDKVSFSGWSVSIGRYEYFTLKVYKYINNKLSSLVNRTKSILAGHFTFLKGQSTN